MSNKQVYVLNIFYIYLCLYNITNHYELQVLFLNLSIYIFYEDFRYKIFYLLYIHKRKGRAYLGSSLELLLFF